MIKFTKIVKHRKEYFLLTKISFVWDYQKGNFTSAAPERVSKVES